MSGSEIRGLKLVELYHRYVGEPESHRDVYGYWLFLVGSVAGLVGVAVFQVEQQLFPGNLQIREVAIVLAAAGLALTMFGVLVLLPVRRRGMQASVVGLAVAFLGIAWFVMAYPRSWNIGRDYSAEIIAVYTAGLGIIAAVAVLVPVVTGEKGLLVEPELGIGSDEPPILLGEENHDAFFAVYETPTNDWAWRIVRRDAVGQTTAPTPTDTDARMAVEDVRERIGDAGLMELTTAAFRLYRTENDQWRWSLVEGDGSLVATNDEPTPDRDSVESTVNFLKEEAPDAGIAEIHGAAIDVYEGEGGRWHWRLIDEGRQPLAAGPDQYNEEATAESAAEQFRDRIEEPRVLALEELGIELFEADGGWRWRVIDGDDRRLATSEAEFESRRDAESAAEDTAGRLSDASIIEHGVAGYELYPRGDGYRWRLRDRADDIVARDHDGPVDRDASRRSAERTREAIGDADVVSFEGLDYEVYPEDGAWHWRLVDVDRTVRADSTERFEDREAAEAAADRVREQALAADLIEFEQAAFQQYESDGEWRWRLIDEDGQVLTDSGETYDSKESVRDGMTTLKEHAPDADVLEIDTAAFELYRDGDAYAWRLIDEAGKLIAESARSYPSRAAARDAVEVVIDGVETAAVRPMKRAIFQLFAEEAWNFRLVHPDGTVLAEGTDTYPTRDDATEAVEAVREAGGGADIDIVGPVTFQLRGNGSWRWRLIDTDREALAEGERSYEDTDAALTDIERLQTHAAEAPVFEIGEGIVWVDATEEGWRWRLVDDDRTVLGVAPERYESEEAVMRKVETVQGVASDAERFDIDTLVFEPYREEDDWRWRLLDEDERTLAVSAVGYEDREAVLDDIEATRGTMDGSSIIEIDEVAFEFHERDGGWGWRLVDEHGSPLTESVEPHPTRQDAREEMLAVKEHAPEGETVVTW